MAATSSAENTNEDGTPVARAQGPVKGAGVTSLGDISSDYPY